MATILVYNSSVSRCKTIAGGAYKVVLKDPGISRLIVVACNFFLFLLVIVFNMHTMFLAYTRAYYYKRKMFVFYLVSQPFMRIYLCVCLCYCKES